MKDGDTYLLVMLNFLVLCYIYRTRESPQHDQHN